jgi:hypothetical protein
VLRPNSYYHTVVEVLALERALGEGSMDHGLLEATREDAKTIAVEYCWTGDTRVDVQSHSPTEGPAEAKAHFRKIISVPASHGARRKKSACRAVCGRVGCACCS